MIKYKIRQKLKTITAKELKRIAPEAYKAANDDDDEELHDIWIMTTKPVPVGQPVGVDNGVPYYYEWTETNEPELAEELANNWDNIAMKFGDQQVVILYGSLDDECGNYWIESEKRWQNYAY